MTRRNGLFAATALTVAAISAAILPNVWNDAKAGAGATDVNGKTITTEARSRILAIGGDVTEILYAVGLQQNIVAVDATSQFPADALKDKKNVGYMRALSTEGVLSTSPSMIIASNSSGPVEVVKALQGSNVPYVEVPENYDPQGVASKIRLVAEAGGAAEKGDALAKEVEQQFAVLAGDRKRITKPLKAIFVLGVQKGVATIAGKGTSASAILELAGMENAASGFPGFKPMVDEALLELQPDVIVVMNRSDPTHDALKALQEVKGLQATPAGKANRIIVMDALYLLGFGPRSPAAARDLMVKAYPEFASAAASSK